MKLTTLLVSIASLNSAAFCQQNIGIGTTTPTAQLHTTSSVRFEGLANDNNSQRFIVQDNAGLLGWRDLSTIVNPGNFWQLSGNSGTTPSNFLGTTDNQRLGFRTNNAERMTIQNNGNVGIAISNPVYYKLEVGTGTDVGINMALLGNAPGMRLYGSNNGNDYAYGGFIALATYTGAYATTAKKGDLVVMNIGSPSNGFNGESSRDLVLGAGKTITNGGFEVMRLTQVANKGRVGIGTTLPSAQFHTTDSIRFENLQFGTGNILVTDASGNVYRSTFSAKTVSDNTDIILDLEAKLTELTNKVLQLEKKLQSVARE